MNKSMICIVCPVGCHVSIDGEKNVTGNRCKRGEFYAIKEVTNPTRMVTSTVRIESKLLPRVSVKTSDAIDKSRIFDVMKALDDVTLKAPVKIGDIVIPNIFGTGVDIVATRAVHE